MVREIMRDIVFLSLRAEPATPADLPVADDLLETLEAHKDGCVRMAANMIGVKNRIIAFDHDGEYMGMFNPEMIKDTVSELGVSDADQNLYGVYRGNHSA